MVREGQALTGDTIYQNSYSFHRHRHASLTMGVPDCQHDGNRWS